MHCYIDCIDLCSRLCSIFLLLDTAFRFGALHSSRGHTHFFCTMDLTCPRCTRTGLRDENALLGWHKQWVRSSTPAPWCCPVHGTAAGLDSFQCGCLKPEGTRSKAPAQAAQAVPPVPDPVFHPCTPPSQSPRERSPASTTMSEAVARHAEIMPAASSSDVITITRGEWEDVMARLRAIEEWLRVAPRVRRY